MGKRGKGIYSATDGTRIKHGWGKDFEQEGTERTENEKELTTDGHGR